MQQYHAAKLECPDCLLFFRLGDFFEMFYDDAITASRDLEITLTKRRDGKNGAIPMCGVPVQAADNYLAKLLRKGHRVAICDQVENAKSSRRLVRREIVRILSPGTSSDLNVLKASENNYLACVHAKAGTAGLAYVDVSTGEFRTTQLKSDDIRDMLHSLGAKEVLIAFGASFDAAPETSRTEDQRSVPTVTTLESWVFDVDYAEQTLLKTFGLHNLDGLGISDRELCVSAAGAAVHYLKETQRTTLHHLDRPTFFEQQDWMVLDPVTIRHLEIFDPLFRETRTTLLNALDRTQTAMGARLQRTWILRPSLDLSEIERRIEAVNTLYAATIARSELRKRLGEFHDIERLLARITLGTAGPRDVRNLGVSLRLVPLVRERLGDLTGDRLSTLLASTDPLDDVCERILSTLSDEPPASIGDGNAIAEGFDRELDELRSIRQDSRGFIAKLERREREATGIDSLKVRYNSVFGFFIEVSRANRSKAPEHYERRQTLVNAERFTTPELKELENKVLDAEDRINSKEAIVFEQLRLEIVEQARRIRRTAAAIAELDVLCGFAHVAVEYGYSRPRFTTGQELLIEGGRHPVVERMLEEEHGERFIENDLYLDGAHLLAIVTGPNMGGKSTYLRQTALIAVMAQTGSFVPARKAVLPLIDRIFTRIGASDNVVLGRSTFMVEMTETAQILNTATERSLVLLDEIGRGTSTYDGLAIAWAVAEHIHDKVRAKTLFATHYHELTALSEMLTGIFNLHVAAKQSGDKLVFLRRIESGTADRSYGIEVARLAGLPKNVLRRAQEVLRQHEQGDRAAALPATAPPTDCQSTIFSALPERITEELRNLKVDGLSPFEALSLLYEWKAALDGNEK